jgi:hypothetical protein
MLRGLLGLLGLLGLGCALLAALLGACVFDALRLPPPLLPPPSLSSVRLWASSFTDMDLWIFLPPGLPSEKFLERLG